MAVAALAHEDDSAAEVLNHGMQLGASRAYVTDYSSQEFWRVWARRADGHLVALLDSTTQPSPTWADWGNACASSNQGVGATSWRTGADQWESALCVSGNTVVETRLRNRLFNSSQAFGPPPGKTLTGYFAVAWRDPAGAPEARPLVFATVKDSPTSPNVRLYVLEIVAGVGTWYALGAQTDYSATSPLAASNTQDGLHARVYASTTGGSVRSVHWDGAPTLVTINPPAGKQLCGTIAAAEGDTGPNGAFRAYFFCTRRDAAETQLLFRFTTDKTGAGGWVPWGAIQLAGGANVGNSGYALAATTLGSNGTSGVHVWALSSTSRLLLAQRTAQGEMPASFADEGDDGEYVWRSGGLVAFPAQTPISYGLYLGNTQFANRLYRRASDDAYTRLWTNHGTSTGRKFVVSDERVEDSSMALSRGRGIAAFRSPSGDPAVRDFVRARWSSNDGETWGPSVELSHGTDPMQLNTAVANPSAAMTDSGTGYVAMWGRRLTNHSCAGDQLSSEAYFQTTTDGVDYSIARRLQSAQAYLLCSVPDPNTDYCPGDPAHPGCTDVSCPSPLDHCFCHAGPPLNRVGTPWVTVEPRADQPDRVHIVWEDANPSPGGLQNWVIRYVRAVDPVGADPPSVALDDFVNLDNLQSKRVTVAAGGVVYIGTHTELCRLDPTTFDACEGQLNFEVDQGTFVSQTRAAGQPTPPIPGTTSDYLDINGSFSLVASPTDPNKVYYAFQRRESECASPCTDELDLWFQVITFDPATGTLIPGPRVALTDVLSDNRDQFSPSLTVVLDSSGVGDGVFASWYDFRGPGCAGGNLNRCYKGKRSLFLPGAMQFGYTQDIPVDAGGLYSDPILLPTRFCGGATSHGLGFYHHVTADRLHSYHGIVGAPLGSNPGTATLSQGWVSNGFWSW